MVVIHTSRDLDKLRESGRIVALVHEELQKIITPGISTLDIDNAAEKIIISESGLPAFKGYKGYILERFSISSNKPESNKDT